ncbi:hypothetical protein [Streptomyces sp. NPDC050564]
MPTGRSSVEDTQPKDGEYVSELSVAFGADVDMTATSLDLTLKTGKFPRD